MKIKLISVLVAFFILIGCGVAFSVEGSSPKTGKVTVIDDFGREVVIEKYPGKIVSLSPSNTEILFALGLGDKIIGVTSYCDYPPEVKQIDKIGGYSTPNIEKIVAKDPDLVLAAYGNGEENIAALEKLGLTVAALNPKNIEDILKDIQLVGKITGEEKKAKQITTEMRKRIEIVREKNAKIPEDKKMRVLYLVWYPQLWTSGKETYPDELIKIAGGKNIAYDIKGWKQINKETVIDRDPQIIICSGMGENGVVIKKNILNDPELKKTIAVKSGCVYAISDSNIIERPGPRIVEGLEKIDELIEESYSKIKEGK
ncbi:cobalamin-binding protein [Candidatus Aerophobetes bacterium]|nr:cobalamin-binding protein [Candidatus Aerophobetes bacterium]